MTADTRYHQETITCEEDGRNALIYLLINQFMQQQQSHCWKHDIEGSCPNT